MSVASSYIHIQKVEVDPWGEEMLMLADILLWNSLELWVLYLYEQPEEKWKTWESYKGCGFSFLEAICFWGFID